jgi:hypothetical protein
MNGGLIVIQVRLKDKICYLLGYTYKSADDYKRQGQKSSLKSLSSFGWSKICLHFTISEE